MHRKVYDENKGIFVFVDAWTGTEGNLENLEGSGIFDTLSQLVSKGITKSLASAGKKALETAGKTALESGTKKIGTEVGNLAADKMISTFKGRTSGSKKSPPKSNNGNLIIQELTKLNDDPENNINIRINKLLSGSGRRNRINKLI